MNSKTDTSILISEFWDDFNARCEVIKRKIEGCILSDNLSEIKLDLNNLQTYATHGARILPL